MASGFRQAIAQQWQLYPGDQAYRGTIMDLEVGEINNYALYEVDGMLHGEYFTTSLEKQA